MFQFIAPLLPLGKAIVDFAIPPIKVAGQVVIGYGAVRAAGVVGKGIGYGIDGVRHMVGYTDNLFSTNTPIAKSRAKKKKKTVSSNKRTASGNRKKAAVSTTAPIV